VKYWEIIADNLSKAGWSWGCVSAIDSNGQTIFVAEAHRDDGKRFIVRAAWRRLFLALITVGSNGTSCRSPQDQIAAAVCNNNCDVNPVMLSEHREHRLQTVWRLFAQTHNQSYFARPEFAACLKRQPIVGRMKAPDNI
jgi:hypothetical protein